MLKKHFSECFFYVTKPKKVRKPTQLPDFSIPKGEIVYLTTTFTETLLWLFCKLMM